MTAWQRGLLLFLMTLGLPARAGLKFTFSGAFVPSFRHYYTTKAGDYYQGYGFGGSLSIVTESPLEIYAAYLSVTSTSNYTDVEPLKSRDQFVSLGTRYYLQNGRLAFLQFAGLGLLSDTFVSPKFGGSFGGGLNLSLSPAVSFGLTTLYSYVFYPGFHRRFLQVTLDVGLEF